MISRCRQVREYCFTHRAHVGDCHGRNVQLQSVRAAQKQGMHFMRHSCTVGFKKLHASRCFLCPGSALIYFVRFSPSSNSLRTSNVISKLLCPRGSVSSQLLLTRHAWTLVHACVPKKRCLHLLDEKSHSAEFAPPFSLPSPLDEF